MRNAIFVFLTMVLVLSLSGSDSPVSAAKIETIKKVEIRRFIQTLTPLGNRLMVCEGYSPESGWEPWVTDGTVEGTRLLADIVPGPTSAMNFHVESDPTFVVLRGEAFFFASDGVNGREVWRTDGTPEGTEILADFIPGPGGFSIHSEMLVNRGRLIITGTSTSSSAPLMYIFEPGH